MAEQGTSGEGRTIAEQVRREEDRALRIKCLDRALNWATRQIDGGESRSKLTEDRIVEVAGVFEAYALGGQEAGWALKDELQKLLGRLEANDLTFGAFAVEVSKLVEEKAEES